MSSIIVYSSSVYLFVLSKEIKVMEACMNLARVKTILEQ